ncbi:MAG: glycosyltransferase family 9 protein [Rhabdochlamydiaceae bacterium]|nr:glycosyltransferase family 9 protein [Candidatus Amphrikana amoebophyrae]
MNKILIIKIGALGDVIMALPILNKLQTTYNNPSIHWLCGSKVQKVIEATQLVDSLSTLNEDHLLRGNFIQKLWQVFRAWRLIGFKKYNQVIIAHLDKRYSILGLFSLSKNRVQFTVEGRKCPALGRYHSFEYVRLVQKGEQERDITYSFPKLQVVPSTQIKRLVSGFTKRYIVIAPGGNPELEPGKHLRMWPVESYLKLVKQLKDSDCQIVLIGGPDDRWLSRKFKGSNVIDCVGKYPLLDLIHLFENSLGVVTHDSGPLHLALISRSRVLALFGPTNPYEKLPITHPEFKGKIDLLWGGETLPCRPCYDGKYYANCNNPLCMKMISIERASEICLRWINQ